MATRPGAAQTSRSVLGTGGCGQPSQRRTCCGKTHWLGTAWPFLGQASTVRLTLWRNELRGRPECGKAGEANVRTHLADVCRVGRKHLGRWVEL